MYVDTQNVFLDRLIDRAGGDITIVNRAIAEYNGLPQEKRRLSELVRLLDETRDRRAA